MATVRIHEKEESGEGLPRLCMRCGGPATGDVPGAFSWVNPWIYTLVPLGLFPFLVVMLFARKTSKIRVPVCDRHVNHWRHREMFMGAGLILGVGVVVLGLSQMGKMDPDTLNVAAVAAVAGALAWVVTAVVLERRAIRPRRMTDHWTDLVNVSPAFAAALDQSRSAAPRIPGRG
ncbi:MAG TPA: hypothetical protein VH092_11450 [Urbifossiella sp.]|jgi:hypothetical protein|nr:hypothetical protein [Urbifossiella sp.]